MAALTKTPAVQGLQLTLAVLTTTKNESAIGVLLPALDSEYPHIADGALRALLDRRSAAGQREILRRLHEHSARWRPIIDERRGRMSYALRDGLLSTDPILCQLACEAVLWFREYDLSAVLVNAAEDETNPNAGLASKTLLALADLLYEELAQPKEFSHRRDPQLVRRNFTSTLENSVQRFVRHKQRDVITAFLVLASRENSVLKQILQDPRHAAYLTVLDELLHNPRGGVVRLLLSFLDDPHAPSAAISTLMRRSDRKFIVHLLRRVGYALSTAATQNVKRVEVIAWLRTDFEFLDELDDAGQHSLLQLVSGCSMKRQEAFKVIEHLVTRGKPGGRRAAAQALARFNGAEANTLALKTLDDVDPDVQAAVATQLRQRGIPGALNRLIELLDSPHEVVRHAARQSLTEFNFDRYLAAFDLLEDEVRKTTGTLVKKVNPQVHAALAEELTARSRTRRLRGLGVAQAMSAELDIVEEIIKLLEDEDYMIRAEAARTLAKCPIESVRLALQEAMHDRSVPVQEAAYRSLQHIGGSAAHADSAITSLQ
jgi:hypothetical protein